MHNQCPNMQKRRVNPRALVSSCLDHNLHLYDTQSTKSPLLYIFIVKTYENNNMMHDNAAKWYGEWQVYMESNQHNKMGVLVNWGKPFNQLNWQLGGDLWFSENARCIWYDWCRKMEWNLLRYWSICRYTPARVNLMHVPFEPIARRFRGYCSEKEWYLNCTQH